MTDNKKISDMETQKMDSSRFLAQDMDKARIIEILRKEGCRVTRQREVLIDIILEEKCTCCKEIYYLAQKKIPGIGVATVYRTVSALEEIGALKRRNSYQLCCDHQKIDGKFLIELDDQSVLEMDWESLQELIERGLKQTGSCIGKRVKAVRQMAEE